MENWQIALSALVQGLTEFLPISSSAHLILLYEGMGWGDAGLSFDAAVHFGTLIALCWYLRAELRILAAFFAPDATRLAASRRLWLLLLVGTLPLLLGGLLLRDWVELYLRQLSVIAAANLFFAALLWRAWQASSRNREGAPGESGAELSAVRLRQALLIGCFQVFALIPGASRAGVTMTAGLYVGLPPATAIRFSFLLGIPALSAAFFAELWHWGEMAQLPLLPALGGAILAGLVALVMLRSLTAFVQRVGVMPFVIYRFLLGAMLLIFFLQPSPSP